MTNDHLRKAGSVALSLDTAWKARFRRRVLGWYRKYARPLPWRRSTDPYRVWISEIMLQQTQVATVARYFERFVATFPSLQALAAADEQQILRAWEGLGYYRRARQMHQAAREIVEKFAGQFPTDPQIVLGLPGIGRYTAGAILSIAFGAHEPILEANSRRVLIRMFGYHGDPSHAESQRWLWQVAAELVPRRNSGSFNQALMELGSLVCMPRAPACRVCPVAALCYARARHLQEILPQRMRKPAVERVQEAAVVVYRGRQILLLRRGEGQRWAGLWDFPRFPWSPRPRRRTDTGSSRLSEVLADKESEALVAQVKELTGVTVRPSAHLLTIRHGVTRFRITLDCFAATYVSGQPKQTNHNRMKWLTPSELEHYPLTSPARKLVRFSVAGERGA